MTRAEPLLPHDGNPSAANDEAQHPEPVQCLRDSVTAAVRHYLKELDGQMSTDVYQMVLAEIEAPLLEAKIHAKGIIARFEGCDDRDAALKMGKQDIAIRREQLPEPEKGEYYWIDLQGLEVKTLENVLLGTVDHIEATGANDVLVVKGERERLIPYVLDHVVHEVNIEAGFIRVDWDPDFD